ncbi:replicative helicase loader/inhibitor [Domibacillus tundrae]|uniref:replicative helicase loader/inhibitor n=1 Tax=Domibacillus tundrae TaxID=1587527 RepID=UPI0006181BAE|nr:replicative helicase loader/inhibitor [Domibacillus tundrae]
MEIEQVEQILNTINAAYSRFEVTDDRLMLWSEMLLDMDYDKVNARLKQHIKANKFPPSVAEISVFETPKNEHLEKVKQWEREGAERIARERNQPKPPNPFK